MEKKINMTRARLIGLFTGLIFGGLLGYTFLRANDAVEKRKCLEQEIQNEIIIDSTKIDTPNYQNSINYLNKADYFLDK